MKRRNNTDESQFGILFSDFLLSLVGIAFFLLALILTLPHERSKSETPTVLGRICAELSWDNARDVDLDLWGTSPAETKPIGYSNMHGPVLDLYRDVLGFNGNPSKINLEIMCSQVIVPGEWTFNAHYFSEHDKNIGVPVEATMTIRYSMNNKASQVYSGKFTMDHEDMEKTFFDFQIDDQGNLMEDSINSVDKPLRSK